MKVLKLNDSISVKLNRLKNPPKELNYSGNDLNDTLSGPAVGIVGTRKPTPYGQKFIKELSESLARAGVCVISGLALGTDALALKYANAAGGKNLAVLPSGIDNVYPATNRPLAEKIKSNGTLISEYDDKHKPMKAEFLERNRIIAALSDILIIPEAALKSGSLNTARNARELGVRVFVLPGDINRPMSAGVNDLLANGLADAVMSPQQILDLLDISPQTELITDDINLSEGELRILKSIKSGAKLIDEIVSTTGYDSVEVQSNLTMLEINGFVQQNSLGEWSI